MNRKESHAQASLFGPPSELINVGTFLHSAATLDSNHSLFTARRSDIAGWNDFEQLSEVEHADIEAECR
jgi:hypothetical protein